MSAQCYKDGSITVLIFCGTLIDERMYVIHEGNQAVVIDPHIDMEALAVLQECDQVYVFLTHEHYDHISGVNWLRENISCTVYASEYCAEVIKEEDNGTLYFPLLFIADKIRYHMVRETLELPYVCSADVSISDEFVWAWNTHRFFFKLTPGHSPGGLSILVDGEYLFSGDNLLGNGQELKSGKANRRLYECTMRYYQTLENSRVLVFPGHGAYGLLSSFISKIKEYYIWI